MTSLVVMLFLNMIGVYQHQPVIAEDNLIDPVTGTEMGGYFKQPTRLPDTALNGFGSTPMGRIVVFPPARLSAAGANCH